LVKHGITETVYKDSRNRMDPESVAQMNVITGLNQTNAELQLQSVVLNDRGKSI